MDQTLKRFIIICFMCQLFLPLIFYSGEIHASVITEMYEINSIDALKLLYEKSNEYNRRYILKNIPDWFDKNGISEIPDWIYKAIEDAIYSKKALLVMEGIILAGEYRFEEFFERLATATSTFKIRAGSTIRLSSEFHAEPGCEMHMQIDPGLL